MSPILPTISEKEYRVAYLLYDEYVSMLGWGIHFQPLGGVTKSCEGVSCAATICVKVGPGDAILLLHLSTRQVDVFRKVPDIIPS